VVADTVHQFAPLVLYRLTGLCPADIAVAQIGNGADYQLRFGVAIAQHHQFVFRGLGHAAHNMDIEMAQNIAGGIQQRGGIVVARRNHHMPAARTGATAQKAIVEFQRPVAGGAVIEYITAHQQCFGPLGCDAADQPVEETLELFVAFSPVQRPADVPVRCVQDFHGKPVPCGVVLFLDDCQASRIQGRAGVQRRGWGVMPGKPEHDGLPLLKDY